MGLAEPQSRRPVEPNPLTPRAVAGNSVTSTLSAAATGATTNWAMRMPRVIVNGRSPRLTKQHLHLAAVVGVDGAGRVEDGDAVFGRKPGAGTDLTLVAGRQGDGETGRDESAGAGFEHGRRFHRGAKVHARGGGGLRDGQRQVGAVGEAQNVDADPGG